MVDAVQSVDPLTGRPQGDWVVALRLSVAASFALWAAHIAGMCAYILNGSQPPGPSAVLSECLIYAPAYALPVGAAVLISTRRDDPRRNIFFRLGESLAIAALAEFARHSWGFAHAGVTVGDIFARMLDVGLMEYPAVIGLAVGLLLLPRHRGQLTSGMALALPTALGSGVVLAHYGNLPTGVPAAMGTVAIFLPLCERCLLQFRPFRFGPPHADSTHQPRMQSDPEPDA